MKIYIIALFLLTFIFPFAFSRGINGGLTCAVCTVGVGFIEQLIIIKKKSASTVINDMCKLFPKHLEMGCKLVLHVYGDVVIEKLEKNETADVICYSIGLCEVDPGQQYCHLFPEPKEGMEAAIRRSKETAKKRFSLTYMLKLHKISPCHWPGLSHFCKTLERAFIDKLPAEDLDGDRFSLFESLRGSSWRGKDCSDLTSDIHPGRRPKNGDQEYDSNCNGIFGVNPSTGKPYEEELCPENSTYGLIYLGDSVGAHFHAPVQWFNAQEFSLGDFDNLTFVLGNELDWPQTSFATGYKKLDWTIMSGPTDSLYLRLREHNLCSHRDYQNIGVNGAGASDVLKFLPTISRNSTLDKPAIVFYAVIGNDVCYPYMKSVNDFIDSKVFRSEVVAALRKLESMLPSGSHVIIMGLLDGDFIYPTMHKRLHPVGEVRGDVTYEDVYEWFNCMHLGPCYGWLNRNETYRTATTKKAREFDKILEGITKEEAFTSFKTYYMENPLSQVMYLWTKDGHPLWKLLEPVDSLHPVQEVQPYVTKVVWKEIQEKFPEIIGKPNPNNPKIKKLFGKHCTTKESCIEDLDS